MKTRYLTVAAGDGQKLRTAVFTPDEEIKVAGVIHMIHGFGEHIGNYISTAEFFAKNGYAFVIHDQRGFGEEWDGKKGVTPGYGFFLTDIDDVLNFIAENFSGAPVFMYGHSMGGNIAVNYFLRRARSGYRKLILESPWLRLFKPPAPHLIALAKILGAISNKITITTELKTDELTRDKAAADKLMSDTAYHNHISFRLFTQIAAAAKYANENAPELSVPTLLLNAGNDRVVSPAVIREFAGKTGDNVIYKEYSDGYHQLHNDIIKDEVLNDILSFLK